MACNLTRKIKNFCIEKTGRNFFTSLFKRKHVYATQYANTKRKHWHYPRDHVEDQKAIYRSTLKHIIQPNRIIFFNMAFYFNKLILFQRNRKIYQNNLQKLKPSYFIQAHLEGKIKQVLAEDFSNTCCLNNRKLSTYFVQYNTQFG